MFSKKPFSVEHIFKLALAAIKGDAVQLTYSASYYRQLVLSLGPLELAHYRPLLSDFRAALQKRLNDWYAEQKLDYQPILILVRSEEATRVCGSFEVTNIPNQL